jgi:hypothetical protein
MVSYYRLVARHNTLPLADAGICRPRSRPPGSACGHPMPRFHVELGKMTFEELAGYLETDAPNLFVAMQEPKRFPYLGGVLRLHAAGDGAGGSLAGRTLGGGRAPTLMEPGRLPRGLHRLCARAFDPRGAGADKRTSRNDVSIQGEEEAQDRGGSLHPGTRHTSTALDPTIGICRLSTTSSRQSPARPPEPRFEPGWMLRSRASLPGCSM